MCEWCVSTGGLLDGFGWANGTICSLFGRSLRTLSALIETRWASKRLVAPVHENCKCSMRPRAACLVLEWVCLVFKCLIYIYIHLQYITGFKDTVHTVMLNSRRLPAEQTSDRRPLGMWNSRQERGVWKRGGED